MIKRKVNIHVDRQMYIMQLGNGIKLITPEVMEAAPTLCQGRILGSIDDFMKLPLNIYFLNPHSQMQLLNDTTAEICGWESIRDALGQSVLDIWPGEFSQSILINDQTVLKKNAVNIVEEDVFDKYEENLVALSFKFPWYNADNKLTGIFGCSIASRSKHHSIAKSLKILSNTGLLTPQQISFPQATEKPKKYFSRRELDVLKLLVRAKTSKEIAGLLGLSYRTVEHYIENSKRKMGVSTKSELVDRIIDIL